ncbi:hypothetical protein NDU88_003405 [Pleurodeles waltl]|uniref:Peptidase A2 domain-containing protein n=1 Tax=Pleurodeles waltl TaxID=8319 RepID=A0AAV7VGH7_PLEWA|nr:hypothetical protein NDU88_003405 [Pleurodeles waltl]
MWLRTHEKHGFIGLPAHLHVEGMETAQRLLGRHPTCMPVVVCRVPVLCVSPKNLSCFFSMGRSLRSCIIPRGDDTENVQHNDSEFVLVVKDAISSDNKLVLDPDIDASVEGVVVKLLVDTGARIAIVSQEKCDEICGAKPLFTADVSTVAFEGSKIDLIGYIWASLSIVNETIQGKVYVAKKGINVLGLIHKAEFNLVIKLGREKPVSIEKTIQVV